MGAALVGVGGLVLTGLDKIIEAALTRAMPDWLVTVTTVLKPRRSSQQRKSHTAALGSSA